MKKFIAFSTFLAYAVLLGNVVAQTNMDCAGPLVGPTPIAIPNFKICEGNYKFDSSPEEDEDGIVVVPGIPGVGECAEFVWYDVPNIDPNGDPGTVKVKVCQTAEGTIKFTVTNGVAKQVYVKGGPGGNLYDYCPEYPKGVDWDCNLVTPTNPNNEKLYGLSNVQFCLKYAPVVDPICVNETAWSAGDRYVDRGNWATFTKLDYFKAMGECGQKVDLVAGQTKDAGTVNFKIVCPDDPDCQIAKVKITIVLNEGFSFRGDEPVKVQDYEEAPSGNPAPGLFAWKLEYDEVGLDTATICVPLNDFYGVHVDLRHCFFE